MIGISSSPRPLSADLRISSAEGAKYAKHQSPQEKIEHLSTERGASHGSYICQSLQHKETPSERGLRCEEIRGESSVLPSRLFVSAERARAGEREKLQAFVHTTCLFPPFAQVPFLFTPSHLCKMEEDSELDRLLDLEREVFSEGEGELNVVGDKICRAGRHTVQKQFLCSAGLRSPAASARIQCGQQGPAGPRDYSKRCKRCARMLAARSQKGQRLRCPGRVPS